MKRTALFGKYCRWFLLILGTVFILLGFLLLLKFDAFHDFIINNALDIRPGTDAYTAWKTNDPPLDLDFYFFNWTNAKDYKNPNVKPYFQQVGPYRFHEVKEKYDVKFFPNKTISYHFYKKYYFLGDKSPRPLSDVIQTVNFLALTAAFRARNAPSYMKWFTALGLSTSKVYVKKSIDELLFTGYEDPLLNVAQKLAPFLKKGANINDRFGWFYKRNFTKGLSGVTSVYVGHDENFGKITSWNYSNRTNFYDGKCGEIHGSAGEFHPLNRKRDSVEIYSPELCTYAILQYEKDERVKGIHAYKYSANTLFDNGQRDPENSCYCKGECIPAGVLNVSECRMNTPIFLSLPHFYNADPYYTEIIDGLNPRKELHDFYMVLEPKSAITLDVGARMQLNALLQPLNGFSLYRDVPKIFAPIFFIDQRVILREDLAPKIKLLQNLPEFAAQAAYYLIVSGFITIVATVALTIMCKKKKDTSKVNTYKVTLTKDVISDSIPLKIKCENIGL